MVTSSSLLNLQSFDKLKHIRVSFSCCPLQLVVPSFQVIVCVWAFLTMVTPRFQLPSSQVIWISTKVSFLGIAGASALTPLQAIGSGTKLMQHYELDLPPQALKKVKKAVLNLRTWNWSSRGLDQCSKLAITFCGASCEPRL